MTPPRIEIRAENGRYFVQGFPRDPLVEPKTVEIYSFFSKDIFCPTLVLDETGRLKHVLGLNGNASVASHRLFPERFPSEILEVPRIKVGADYGRIRAARWLLARSTVLLQRHVHA